MEGTDAAILRAGGLMKSPSLGEADTSRAHTVIRSRNLVGMRFGVGRRNEDHRNHEACRRNVPGAMLVAV
jgi:hypothetical protein